MGHCVYLNIVVCSNVDVASRASMRYRYVVTGHAGAVMASINYSSFFHIQRLPLVGASRPAASAMQRVITTYKG